MLFRAASILALLTAVACEVGVVGSSEGLGGGMPSPDGGDGDPGGGGDDGAGSGGGGGTPDAAVNPADNCELSLAGLPSGNHNAGAVCRSCHDGSPAPNWTIAGTIYASPAGTAALPGATIHITDADGTELTLTSALNGNFWTPELLTFPLTVRATRCDADKSMPTQVQTAGASCNSCHASGSRIALP